MDDALLQGLAMQELVEMTNHLANLNAAYLGASITILLFLGGVAYVFNVAPLREKLDKQEALLLKLKSDVENNLFSSKKEIADGIEKFKTEQSSSLLGFVDQKNKQLFTDVEKQIAQFESNFSQRFGTLAGEKDNDLKIVLLSEMQREVNELEKKMTEKLRTFESERTTIKDDIFSIKRDLVELQIEYHLGKKQVGALRMMIERLNICITQNWGFEEALLDIEKYIENKGMPSFYLKELQQALEKVPKEFSLLAEKIRQLASTKAYNPHDKS